MPSVVRTCTATMSSGLAAVAASSSMVLPGSAFQVATCSGCPPCVRTNSAYVVARGSQSSSSGV